MRWTLVAMLLSVLLSGGGALADCEKNTGGGGGSGSGNCQNSMNPGCSGSSNNGNNNQPKPKKASCRPKLSWATPAFGTVIDTKTCTGFLGIKTQYIKVAVPGVGPDEVWLVAPPNGGCSTGKKFSDAGGAHCK